jgi:hypothetical protein
MKKLITDFLEKYCTLVKDDDSDAYVDLMVDNHSCVLFEDIEWYVPDTNSLWSEDESLLQDFIVYSYGI